MTLTGYRIRKGRGRKGLVIGRGGREGRKGRERVGRDRKEEGG